MNDLPIKNACFFNEKSGPCNQESSVLIGTHYKVSDSIFLSYFIPLWLNLKKTHQFIRLNNFYS